MLIAQLSDLHIMPRGHKLYDFIDTNGLLARHIAYLNNLDERPDAVVITGDITDAGSRGSYEMTLKLLNQLDYPTFIIPGNHDCNPEMLRILKDAFPYLGEDPDAIHFTIEDFPIRMICLDSSVEGKLYGRIGSKRLQWLQDSLTQRPETQTIIFTHHHPVPSGCHHMDLICCEDGQELLGVLKNHPQVTHLFCGHTHRAIFQQRDGLLIGTAPSVAHQVPFNSTDPNGFFSLEPPGMLMHRYTPETGLVSYVASLAPFDGPFRFECVSSGFGSEV